MSATYDTDEVLVPGPETRAKVEDILDKIARLSEELAFFQRELTLTAPEGFNANAPGGSCSCCASPVLGYTIRRDGDETDAPAPWVVLTVTLKNHDGCCLVENYATEEEAMKAAWGMAEANSLVWSAEAAK